MIYVTVRLLWRSEFEPSSNRSVQVQGASPNRTSVRFAFRQKGPRTELNRTEPSLIGMSHLVIMFDIQICPITSPILVMLFHGICFVFG